MRRLEYRGYDSAGISFDCDPVHPVNGTTFSVDGTFGNGVAHLNGLKPEVVLEKASASIVSTPVVIKSSGKVDALVKLAYEEAVKQGIDLDEVLDNHAGIAHTRWATHGVPSATNSHPQVSDAEHKFVVVHNGIITNYKALKDFLVRLSQNDGDMHRISRPLTNQFPPISTNVCPPGQRYFQQCI